VVHADRPPHSAAMSLLPVVKPIAGAVVVIATITMLHDSVPDAGVRSAIGWAAASVVTEAMAAWWSRFSSARGQEVEATEAAS
jgi:hypothetical protein